MATGAAPVRTFSLLAAQLLWVTLSTWACGWYLDRGMRRARRR
jgi:hypothetical protein